MTAVAEPSESIERRTTMKVKMQKKESHTPAKQLKKGAKDSKKQLF